MQTFDFKLSQLNILHWLYFFVVYVLCVVYPYCLCSFVFCVLFERGVLFSEIREFTWVVSYCNFSDTGYKSMN
jgi:hypothetical protein